MKRIIFLGMACLLSATIALGQGSEAPFQLRPPLFKYGETFVKKKGIISLEFAMAGSEIRYTTNGVDPDEKSPLYQKPLAVAAGVVVKARTYKPGFAPSDTKSLQFYERGWSIASISCPEGTKPYASSGPACLNDLKASGVNYAAPGWLGYHQLAPVTFDLALDKTRRVSSILLSVLQDQNAWIFLPQQVKVYYRGEGGDYIPVAVFNPANAVERTAGATASMLAIPVDKIKAKAWRVEVFPLQAMPEWHAGKGQPAWFFVNEIKVY